jgi:hypothetical protein
LIDEEQKEKVYVRIALLQNGVYGLDPDVTKSFYRNPNDSSSDASYKKLKHVFLEKYFVYFFLISLTIAYAVSLTNLFNEYLHETWYIFPTFDSFEHFQHYINRNQSNAYLGPNKYSDWCSLISSPVRAQYSNSITAGGSATSLLQAVLFFQMTYTLWSSQVPVYDFMDFDEYMDARSQESCPYYNIHEFRSRNFTNIMLDDWMVLFVSYPVLKSLLDLKVASSDGKLPADSRGFALIRWITSFVKIVKSLLVEQEELVIEEGKLFDDEESIISLKIKVAKQFSTTQWALVEEFVSEIKEKVEDIDQLAVSSKSGTNI